MGVKDEATRLHGEGFNCAQSVLTACRDYTGLGDAAALAVSGGFGGGMRCGEVCGALSGALMAVGLACPYTDGADLKAKNRIAELARVCTGRFKEEFGCVRCAELKAARKPCPELIEYGAALAEEIIRRERN